VVKPPSYRKWGEKKIDLGVTGKSGLRRFRELGSLPAQRLVFEQENRAVQEPGGVKIPPT
jgi:hypothetical protein